MNTFILRVSKRLIIVAYDEVRPLRIYFIIYVPFYTFSDIEVMLPWVDQHIQFVLQSAFKEVRLMKPNHSYIPRAASLTTHPYEGYERT